MKSSALTFIKLITFAVEYYTNDRTQTNQSENEKIHYRKAELDNVIRKSNGEKIMGRGLFYSLSL